MSLSPDQVWELVLQLVSSLLISVVLVPPVFAVAASVLVDILKPLGIVKDGQAGYVIVILSVLIMFAAKAVEKTLGVTSDNFLELLPQVATFVVGLIVLLRYLFPMIRETLIQYNLAFSYRLRELKDQAVEIVLEAQAFARDIPSAFEGSSGLSQSRK